MLHSYTDYKDSCTYSADVVVIGTGAGGAVVGTELAETGVDVLFVEEGAYHAPSTFNPYLTESIGRLTRDNGTTIIHGKVPIPYVEGRCVGGSTVINGGMTWRTPERVLEGWEKSTGCKDLGPAGMEPLFERVEARVHAGQHVKQAVGDHNRVMVGGAQKQGWKFEVNHRNQHKCVGTNNCVLGCPTGAKQSTLVSYMPGAMKAGARCITQVRITSLIIKNGRCRGVRGRAVNPRTMRMDKAIEIHANAVVVACGAVQTPHLLLRHKLGRPSKQLGKNFTCHPNVKCLAVYPFDVRGWQGVNQYAQIREFHDEGIVLAENMVAPAAISAHLPHHGAKGWELMKRYNQMVLSGVLVEDSTTGRVVRGPFDMPIPKYDITQYDHERCIKGAKLLAQMHFDMGAEFVITPFISLPIAYSMDEINRIDADTYPIRMMELVTMHLMGTAAMGSDPQKSVLNLDGQMWDLPGCFVADASVFPTAIGVNPQITIYALATRIAFRLAEQLPQLRQSP
jgi:choline dehydrogenase-like flavoprotein